MTRRSHVVRTGDQAGAGRPRTLSDGGGGGGGPPEVLWGIPGALYPQHSATWTTSINCAVAKLVVTFFVAPTGGTTSLELFRDRDRVWMGNVPPNTFSWIATSPETLASVMDQTIWHLRCTSVGTGGPTGMSVTVRYA